MSRTAARRPEDLSDKFAKPRRKHASPSTRQNNNNYSRLRKQKCWLFLFYVVGSPCHNGSFLSLRLCDEEKPAAVVGRALSNAHLCLAWDKIVITFWWRRSLPAISTFHDCYLLPAPLVVVRRRKRLQPAGNRLLLFTYSALAACKFDSSLKTNGEVRWGESKKAVSYPRCPSNTKVLHHFFKRCCLLCLFLVM